MLSICFLIKAAILCLTLLKQGTLDSHACADNINPFTSTAMPFLDYPAIFPAAVPGEFTSLLLQAHGNAAASSSARRLDFQ